jgi:two-component system, NtrC family, response regulator AtoC
MADKVVETMRVLVVSRETALLRPLWSIGESNSWHLETAASGWEAMERVQSGVAPHVLLLDLPRGDADSLHILRWLRRLRPDLPVVVVCHPEDTGKQKEATRLGAQEVLVPPFDESQLERVILNLHFDSLSESIEMEIASDDIESVGEDESFLSVGPVMQRLRAQAELLAQADVPVLILGEPGSGKTTVARLIHKLSVHSGFSFQIVNCAMMPGHLIEIELFGRMNDSSSGTATGKTSPGKLDLAEKGTLLLEEITEMPVSLQSRLLQVLQDKQFVRPGENQPVRTVVRILATSSANLGRALAEKRLREDLYYRLSAFTVHVPPLRQRKNEIKVLLQYFMHKVARYYGLPPREFSPSVLQACVTHFWPGNLKELETFVKRYLVAGDQEFVLAGHESASGTNRKAAQSSPLRLSVTPSDVEAASRGTEPRSLKSLIQSVKSETERNAIAAALEKTRWNRKAAARLLRVSYRTLLYKIDYYHMRASDTRVLPFQEEG